jgi:hypothetical protein
VHRAIPRIAVIFDVIRELAQKIGIHAARAPALVDGNAPEPTVIKMRHSHFIAWSPEDILR